MAKKPDLLKETIGALRAIQRLNLMTEADDGDPQMHCAIKRVDRVLAKAAKPKAA
jgi:hypothetical protein